MLLILIHSSSLPTYPPCQSRSAATAPLQRRYSAATAPLWVAATRCDFYVNLDRPFYVNLDTYCTVAATRCAPLSGQVGNK